MEAKNTAQTNSDHPVFEVATFCRDEAIIQRDQPVPVRGFANKGVEMTVTLGGVTQTTVAGDRQQWSVSFPARKHPCSLSQGTAPLR